MPRYIHLALLATLPLLSLSTFSPNSLSTLFPPPYRASLHDIHISANRIYATGTFTMPADASAPSFLVDHPDLPASDARTSLVLLTLTTNATLLWAARVAHTLSGASATLAVVEDTVYVAGATVTGSVVLASYDFNGTPKLITTHSEAPGVFVALHPLPDALLLLQEAPSTHPYYNSSTRPTNRGLLLLRASLDSLEPLKLLALPNPSSTSARLVRDRLWDLAVGIQTVFVATRRSTEIDFVQTHTPTLFGIDPVTLQPQHSPRNLPLDLQNTMSLAAHPDGSVLAAFVSRTRNREQIVVRRHSKDLSSVIIVAQTIVQDTVFTRTVRSDVRAAELLPGGQLVLLTHSAELLDRSDEDYVARYRMLSNGRPGVLLVGIDGGITVVEQSVYMDAWQPLVLAIAPDSYIVAGIDEGVLDSERNNAPGMLLTSIERTVPPSPTPVPSGMSKTTASPSASPVSVLTQPVPSPDAVACVGASSVLRGQALLDGVRKARLRVQWHPLRWASAPTAHMMCLTWGNGTDSSRLCATPFHIVRWRGQARFMRDLCAETGPCTRRVDVALGFKGACGSDIVATPFLSVTMHSATDDRVEAEEVAARECRLRERNWLRWVVSTL